VGAGPDMSHMTAAGINAFRSSSFLVAAVLVICVHVRR